MKNNQMVEIKVTDIYPNPKNPRKEFDSGGMAEMIKSVAGVGVLQPVIVIEDKEKNMFRLVAGERRWRAAQGAELDSIPAIVRDLTPDQEIEIMVVENLQRKDINPIEEGQGFLMMKDELGYTQEQLAEKLGCSQGHIANRIRLLKLPEETQEKISRKIISAGHGVQLVGLKDKNIINKVIEKIEKDNVPVAETKNLIYKVVAGQGRPLYKDGYYSPNKPKFNLRGCKGCEHKKEGKDWDKVRPFCVKVSCWEQKQAEALQQIVQEALNKTGDKEIIDISKVNYDERFSFEGDFNGIDKGECEECEHLKLGMYMDGNYQDGPKLYCFNKECHRKKQLAATKEKNKLERERKKSEIENINYMTSLLARQEIGKKHLIWIVAVMFGNVKQYNERPTVFKYVKEKFGWEDEIFKSPYAIENKDFDYLLKKLESLPEDQLKEIIFEWPMVAEGLDIKCHQYLTEEFKD